MKNQLFLGLLFVFFSASALHAQAPTSRTIPFTVTTTLTPGPAQQVNVVIVDAATGGNLMMSELQTVDADPSGNVSFLLGSQTAGGLDPTKFPSGADRFLDVLDGTGASGLAARIPLYATTFAVSSGPAGDVTGNLTMVDSTATAGNILKGGVLFLHNFGVDNTFIGRNAGNLTTIGSANTASGALALQGNTNGSYNTASGVNALHNNTTGFSNTASGFQALLANTIGAANTASGVQTLLFNTSGSRNTASGVGALMGNITGDRNTASGAGALQYSGSGSNNTASGVFALQSNTNGSDNTASGFNALQSNIRGFSNTASGVGALQSNIAGYQSTASGFNALQNNDGADNTAIGAFSLPVNTTGYYNTATGFQALQRNTTGFQNTAIGVGALSLNTAGSLNTAVGYGANVVGGADLTNATAIGAYAQVVSSNRIRLGNTAVTIIEGQVAYTFTSDKDQKENFQPVDGEQVLRKIGGLNLTSWNYIGHDPKRFRHYGPVAQEIFGAFGHDAIGTIGNSTTINSGDMEGILMIGVQTLEKRTGELRQQNETLKAENAELRSRLESIERRLGGNAFK
jgi:hypothetical protein